ncbi:GntR family transcriptional regulator [Haloactinomyces albus]|uniref:DNA-binding transcriptional regulator YhcF (GntR family) n=1 Tax=Haloactinomyces albus TaxID=1352928 RepID=A0AAE3ZA66_9ACTN|nr:GntR family transcriptional regulator [Haloactinomyces albus]MDR7301173.1 DNA-binding transcriptional regulator YhcF (GntR family) [Haloactinomyces albus]
MLRLDSAEPGPLHERIAAAVRRAVCDGELEPGTRLPTARELASQFDVNINTVLRAYRQLSAEELVELRRGRGAIVRGDADRARLYSLADELLAEAARLGISRGELAALLASRS